MNKKIKIGLGIVMGLILLFLAYYWYIQVNGSKETDKNAQEEMLRDPFAGVVVPDGTDPDTRVILEEKISLTKEMHGKMPNIWETWVAIGNLKSLLGDHKGALVAYQYSVALQPNNIVAERNIAALYANHLQDYEKAAAHYRTAIKNEVNNSELYSNLVNIEWKKLKNIKNAEAALEDGLNRTRRSYDLVSLAVEFYEGIGQAEKANQYREELSKMKPPTEPVPAILGVPTL